MSMGNTVLVRVLGSSTEWLSNQMVTSSIAYRLFTTERTKQVRDIPVKHDDVLIKSPIKDSHYYCSAARAKSTEGSLSHEIHASLSH